MSTDTPFLLILALLGWGVGSFLSKIAADRIGGIAVFWDMVGYTVVTIIYAIMAYKPAAFAVTDSTGVAMAALSGIIGAAGAVAFYLLMVQKDASVVAPLTAVYPAVTAILAFLFLRESVSSVKILGILFAVASVYFLSR